MARVALLATSSVWPSAGALATDCAATTVPAPGRLMTITVWPSCRLMPPATVRASRSVVPPAAKGTTRLMGWVGKSAAAAGAVAVKASSAASAVRRVVIASLHRE